MDNYTQQDYLWKLGIKYTVFEGNYYPEFCFGSGFAINAVCGLINISNSDADIKCIYI